MRDIPAEMRDTPWRCAVCGAADIVAVRPGSQGIRDLFLLKRDIPDVAWCRACWNQRWRKRAARRA